MDLANIKYESFEKSIKDALDAIAAHRKIAEQSAILIKPNLVNSSPHPITTSPECCRSLINYIRQHSNAKIIIDLNRYLTPDLSVMDCSIGMAEFHLGGPECNPHVKRIIAGYNPWQVDRKGAELLGLDLKNIDHITAGYDQ